MSWTQAETEKIDEIAKTVTRTDTHLKIICPIVDDVKKTQQNQDARISRLEWVWAAVGLIATAIGGTALAMSGAIVEWFKN